MLKNIHTGAPFTLKDVQWMCIIAIVTCLGYGMFASGLAITDTVESNYALTAKEMFLAHDWISPRIFGQYWFDKPPLEYWAIMLSYALFGISETSARLPSFIVAGAGTAAMYGMVQYLFGHRRLSLWASSIAATSIAYWYISHAILTDGWLFLFSVGIFLFSYLGLTYEKKGYMRLAYICAGLAVLTKGPVGILLPGIVLVCYASYLRKKSVVKILFDPMAILLFAIVALPWYMAMYQVHGMEFITGFLGLHNVVRATESEHPRFNYWFYYLIIWPVSMLPWTGAILYEMVHQGKALVKGQWGEHSCISVFSFLWTAVVMLFYSIVATKYLTYIYIAYIPAFIWGAQGVMRWLDNGSIGMSKKIAVMWVGPVLLLMVLIAMAGSGKVAMPWLILSVVVLLSAVVWIVRKYCAKSAFFWIACIWSVVLWLLPIQLAPIIEEQSGRRLVSYSVHKESDQVYFYKNYPVSYAYYANLRPSYLIHTRSLTDAWFVGKLTMPYTIFEEFRGKSGDLIVVHKKGKDEFLQTNRIIGEIRLVGEEEDWIIFEVH